MNRQLHLLSARDLLTAEPVPDLAAADVIVASHSGGKDSMAALDETVRRAEAAGVRDRVVVLHCDLGVTPRGHTVEWPGAVDLARRHADFYGLPFEVRRSARWPSLVHRIRDRGQFPGLFTRYCTSEMKYAVARKFITEQVATLGVTGRPARVVLVLGLRAEESRDRAAKPTVELDRRSSSGRRTITLWYPVLRWSTAEVWDRVRATGLPHHPAYDQGMSRLSCSFCVLASIPDLICAARLRPELADEYTRLEADMGSPFRRELPMSEVIRRAGRAA
ncbi:phosphoadenosine phosphosulfate reductase family protein [Streptomyces sp. PTM05]|uniref:Phosphoadenosine phosphosulfate reductase family protein n=1 Tax=Streptantibioticus parmotrematis TaxID=2873249 RepID=A0ABS7QNS1_9ACTN|nr:phosphoadenosine phosphosulfate reductase family protein [Streptantibioticus parmotrematis]MBY8884817.1 phosphoadenosine phosphosulfate reductase family protein [Streptantibioticus parmotrematis]